MFGHVRGKVQVSFEDLGERNLKNMAEPVQVYRVSGTTADAIAPRKTSQLSKVSIAVLPFTNMSGDPNRSISLTVSQRI